MLTDIFLNRYLHLRIWTAFEERDRRFLVQAFRIIEEQVFPYFVEGRIHEPAKKKWETIHAKLSTELGLKELSKRHYWYQSNWTGTPQSYSATHEWNLVCEKFVCAAYDSTISADQFMKERISFFEIALRERYEMVQQSNQKLPKRELRWERHRIRNSSRPISFQEIHASGPRTVNRELNERYQTAAEEFNVRIRQAGYPLNYHNGLVQLADDKLVESEIEKPFWSVVSNPTWQSVDLDMKEALDRRDAGKSDSAFYAVRALEGVIKIISEKKGWTHGGEKGAQNFLDNLGSAKNGAFIAPWEKNALRHLFSNVRNPLAHAPGSADMPELTPAQTAWAIQSCMAWIKSLIQRM